MNQQKIVLGTIIMIAGVLLVILVGLPVLFFAQSEFSSTGASSTLLPLGVMGIGAGMIYWGWYFRKRGKQEKILEHLRAADFPTIDPKLFYKWQNVQLQAQEEAKWVLQIGLMIIGGLMLSRLVLQGLLLDLLFLLAFFGWNFYGMLSFVRPLRKTARALQKEAGIDQELLKQVLAGETVSLQD